MVNVSARGRARADAQDRCDGVGSGEIGHEPSGREQARGPFVFMGGVSRQHLTACRPECVYAVAECEQHVAQACTKAAFAGGIKGRLQSASPVPISLVKSQSGGLWAIEREDRRAAFARRSEFKWFQSKLSRVRVRFTAAAA